MQLSDGSVKEKKLKRIKSAMRHDGSVAEWSLEKAIAAQNSPKQVERVPSKLNFDHK